MLPIVFREDGTNERREIDEVGVKLVLRLKASDPNKTKHLATVALQFITSARNVAIITECKFHSGQLFNRGVYCSRKVAEKHNVQ